MNLDELIERLEELRDEVGGEIEVRLMTQQSWPFENAIHGITTAQAIQTASLDDEDRDDEPDESDLHVVYIVEGQQLGYGTKAAWNACL